MTVEQALECYSIGHSDRPPEELLALLERYGIDLVVDVRSFPYSTYLPHYDKHRLDAVLHRRGISYIWMGLMLGSLTLDGRLDPIAKEREKNYQEGISKLMDLLPGRKVCLLSSEAEWQISHRHNLIAQTLMRYGIIVRHIDKDGDAVDAPADLFHLEDVSN
ncbi:MAG: DUF488 domain-containing protein [bacterium]